MMAIAWPCEKNYGFSICPSIMAKHHVRKGKTMTSKHDDMSAKIEELRDRSREFSDIGDFQKADSGSSKPKTGSINVTKWPDDPDALFSELLERAKPYSSSSEFEQRDLPAYKKALRLGIHREIGEFYGWETRAPQVQEDDPDPEDEPGLGM